MPEVQNNEDIQWAIDEIAKSASKVTIYNDYYQGNQPLAFASDIFKKTFAQMFGPISINMCRAVIDTITGRLRVQGFSAETEGNSDQIAAAAAEVWEMNRMNTRARQLIRASLVGGESFLIVWPEVDTEEPVLYPQPAGTCAVRYHDERVGYIVLAAKMWITHEKYFRLNLYYRDRIEKYISTQKTPNGFPSHPNAFKPYETESEPWPLPNPWDKVPVFHFPNGEHADSDLKDLIGVQNAVNKTICDEIVAMEYFASPQRWVIGVETDSDLITDEERAEQEQWKKGIERLWAAANENVKFGQFDPSNPNSFLQVKSDFFNDIALITGIPPYHFGGIEGQIPSGAALSILESRFSEKIEDLQGYWSDPFADAMRLALKMRGNAGDMARLRTEWEDTTPRDPLSEAQTQEVLQRVGVSKKQSLSELGYSDTRIKEMEGERESDQKSAGALMSGFFDRGAI